MLCTDWQLFFVLKVWNRHPSFPEIVRRHFRLAFSGEHSLLLLLTSLGYTPIPTFCYIDKRTPKMIAMQRVTPPILKS